MTSIYNITIAFTDGSEKSWYGVTDLQAGTNTTIIFNDNAVTVTIFALHVRYFAVETLAEDEEPHTEKAGANHVHTP